MIRAGLMLLGSLALAGCFNTDGTPLDSEDTGGCPIGSETCACTQAGTCDPGLQCLSGLCVVEVGMTSTTSGEGSSSGEVADDTTTTAVTTTTADDTDDTATTDTTDGDPCGGQCSADETCLDGECVPGCAPGEIVCDGACIDPLADMDHCGAIADCLGDNAGVACDPTPLNPCPGALGQACVAGQCAAACPTYQETFAVTGTIEELILPMCVSQVHVVATGAQGGSSSGGSAGGLGATVEGDLCVTPGTTLSILVGEQAEPAPYPCGGGGGSFVVDGVDPLFVAGGGGGGYLDWAPGGSANALTMGGPGVGGTANNNGGGGGGFSEDGMGAMGSGGQSFLNGGMAGVEYPLGNTNIGNGGFGGGGGSSEFSTYNAGGGGGYDGGNSGNGNASTGGTSFMTSMATNATFTPAINMGSGSVEISW